MTMNKSPRRYVLTVALIYSLIILIYAAAFSFFNSYQVGLLKQAILSMEKETIMEKAVIRSTSSRIISSRDLNQLAVNLADMYRNDDQALALILFSPTADENYFRVRARVQILPEFTIPFSTGNRVRGPAGSKYLKEGRTAPAVDPAIYRKDELTWKYVHFPVHFRGQDYVATVALAEREFLKRVEAFTIKTRWMRIMVLVLSLLLVLGALAATLLFYQNFQLIIRKLSAYIERAAQGDLEVTMDTPGDEDLQGFARSFNSLVGEMKEMKEEPGSHTSELFNRGVETLKEGNTEQARALFMALMEFNPKSFGAAFNLGVIHAREKQFDRARDYFRRAKELNPSHGTTDQYLQKVTLILEKRKQQQPPQG